jgi:GAF domain-containing protein
MALTEPLADQAPEPVPRESFTFTDWGRRTFKDLSLEEARDLLQVRPDPVAGIRRSGPDPYRLLMFGGGALEGSGLSHHDLGLPGRAAEQLARETGRGVQVDVVVRTDPTTPASIAGLGGLRLRRYDAVIILLGEPPAQQSTPSSWRGALVGLVRVLLSEASPAAGLHVWDTSQSMTALGSRRSTTVTSRLTGVAEEVCVLTGRVRFGELPPPSSPPSTGRFSEATYQTWAELMVAKLRPRLAELDRQGESDTPAAFRGRPDDERLRQRALTCARLVPGRQNERLEQEVRRAARMFQVSGAALTVVDGDWTWMKASTGPLTRSPRANTICDRAIRSDRLTLVNDVQRDPLTRDIPLIESSGVRFYAGFPIHTWDGYRIGMLCIQDGTPRYVSPRELEGLRDIAGRIEQLIWSEALKRRSV